MAEYETDDFETEVSVLRDSRAFQRFLDERSKDKRAYSLDDIEDEIEEERAKHRGV